jgi:hypothetical protein
MRRRCIAALMALIGVTISVSALAADESRAAKMMQAAALAVRSVIDNERVTVWDTTGELPAAAHDFVRQCRLRSRRRHGRHRRVTHRDHRIEGPSGGPDSK